MQHRDGREQEAIGDGDEEVVDVRISEVAERDDREVRGAGDRAPECRLPGGGYFVGVDGGFF
jgi:hypothetical protein